MQASYCCSAAVGVVVIAAAAVVTAVQLIAVTAAGDVDVAVGNEMRQMYGANEMRGARYGALRDQRER
jgi:hypothetical protein